MKCRSDSDSEDRVAVGDDALKWEQKASPAIFFPVGHYLGGGSYLDLPREPMEKCWWKIE